MKSKIIISVLFVMLIITYSCSSGRKMAEQGRIFSLSDSSTPKEGSIVYGLPRTVFTVNVAMERTIEIPGPYARFAGDLLGLNDVIQNESESWSIENVTVSSHDEIDPSEFYVIESNSVFQTNVLALKKEGLILDLNPDLFYSQMNQKGDKESSKNRSNSFDLGSDEYFQIQSDTAYRRLTIDSSFVRIPYVVEKRKRLTTDQLAEKAAKRLMDMRDGKHLILTGEANVFPQNEAVIVEMNRVEKEYTELFTGKILKEIRRFSYQIIPDKKMVARTNILFRFSESTGPVQVTSNGGTPVTIEFAPEQKTKNLTIISKPVDQGESKYDKIYYRVPDVVNMKVVTGKEILFDSRRLIYQFGDVIQLPANYIIGK